MFERGRWHMDKKPKIIWIEVLRITACFAVVLLHVSSMQFNSIPVNTLKWQALNFWNSITRFAVPIFFMISGVLYLNPSKKISIADLYKKYIGKLFICYWFWLLFYGAWNVIVYFEIQMTPGALIKEIFKTAILSPPAHMWYLPTFIGILIVCPVLKLITEKGNSQLLFYCMIVFLAFGILKNTMFLFQITNKDLVATILNTIFPEMLTGWIGFFLLGYFMNQLDWSKKAEKGLYLAGVLSVLAGVLLNAYRSLLSETGINDFCNNLTLFQYIFAIAVFLFFKKKLQISKIDHYDKIILKISRCTLGIYIIHPCWIDLFEKAGITGTSLNPWIMVPVLGLLIFVGSWLATLLLKKIPYIGNWVV